MAFSDKYITFNEAAKRWPNSLATYDAWARNKPKKLPPIFWLDGKRYFLRDDVAKFEADMVKATKH